MLTKKVREKALLVGFYEKGSEKKLAEEYLRELKLLAETLGIEESEIFSSFLKKIDPSTYIGSGKVEEIAAYLRSGDFTVVIFDEEITPAQQRNLEKAFSRPVIERTEVILGVFAQRARTKEAKLQIELARAKYQLPRLKRLWTHLSRQRGGGVNMKGEGEKQIEIDKRLLSKEIYKLERELKVVEEQRMIQRTKRLKSSTPSFAIVGYTNAGKSTLLKALTEADVFIEDKLFATLDTTVKQFILPNRRKILLVDTVGFIRKIPHSLVAAFKSTLEESLYTDILLHVIDVSDPMAPEHAEATLSVLKELKVDHKPMITLFNKIDRCENLLNVQKLRLLFPYSVKISALTREGFEELFDWMTRFLNRIASEATFIIPQKEYKCFSEIMEKGTVVEHEYRDNDIYVKAFCSPKLIGKYQKFKV